MIGLQKIFRGNLEQNFVKLRPKYEFKLIFKYCSVTR